MAKRTGESWFLVKLVTLLPRCCHCCHYWSCSCCSSCSFISFRTAQYKLHYYETPTSLKFVMLSDTKTQNLRFVLHQIYVNLYVEYGMMFPSLVTCGSWLWIAGCESR